MFGRKAKNKKGSIQDIVLTASVLFFFAIVILIGFKVSDEINTNVQANSNIPTEAKIASSSLLGSYSGVMDNGFLFLAVILSISALVLAGMVVVHPIFVIPYMIAMVLIIIVSGALSNAYEEIASNSQLVGVASQLVFVDSIMSFLPLFIGVLSIILMVVLHKTRDVV